MTGPVNMPSEKPMVGITLAYSGLLLIAWIGAWFLNLWLEEHSLMPAGPFATFFYWTVMRASLWVFPSIVLIRRSGRKLRDILTLKRVKTIAGWGGGIGMILGIVTLITRAVQHQPLFSLELSWSLLTAVIIAPIVEEITFRGAVMGALETRCSFAVSNLVSGILFLLMHFPGWYFKGVLMQNLTAPIGGALAILLLGWIFGYAAHKSKSLAGSILTHMLNNFFSA
jgi:uncharacterized protein